MNKKEKVPQSEKEIFVSLLLFIILKSYLEFISKDIIIILQME
jgi:hypothetical protein